MDHGDHPLSRPLPLHRQLCRSVFAEYFLRRMGGQRFEVHSAGATRPAS